MKTMPRPRLGLLSALTAAAVLAAATAPGAPAAAAPPEDSRGWTALDAVAPGTRLVIVLSDGRQLPRRLVSNDATGLLAADLDRVTPRARRLELERLLAASRPDFLRALGGRDGQALAAVVERFDRPAIVLVARPKSWTLEHGPAAWLLSSAAPCPNCDVVQSWPSGKTVTPSPLEATAPGGRTFGEILYAAPSAAAVNALDAPTWQQLKDWLPPSLKGK